MALIDKETNEYLRVKSISDFDSDDKNFRVKMLRYKDKEARKEVDANSRLKLRTNLEGLSLAMSIMTQSWLSSILILRRMTNILRWQMTYERYKIFQSI